jgi:hypothetical protein
MVLLVMDGFISDVRLVNGLRLADSAIIDHSITRLVQVSILLYLKIRQFNASCVLHFTNLFQ